ncbi:MAG: hypothetical protein HY842_07150, partial [Bacteroidetes bacterium]|nr:hypothetical protein [Bacteroidota bacterium]
MAAFFLVPKLILACDTSGYQMNNITDNGDGTFTIQWTAMVAGGTTTSVGSTWGFYLNIDAQILSINPPSFTSSNGTTLNAVVSGGNVAWGNPVPFSGPVFLDISVTPADEWFPFTMVVQGIPTVWDGGGQEANMCPGGPGTGDTYDGVFPCFEPVATPLMDEVHICPGGTAVLTVIPNYLTETVTWSPGGQTGNTISVSPPENQLYTITAANAGCETTTTIYVVIDPLPVLTPLEDEVEVCEGTPAILNVNQENVDFIVWNTGDVGPFLVDIPTMSPMTYTATGSNICGDTTVEIVVISIPFTTVDASPDETICQGESTTLQADTTDADMVVWYPGGINGPNINVSPTSTTNYFVVASNYCGTDTAFVTVTVANNAQTSVQLSACDGETVLYNGIPLSAGTTSTFTFNTFLGCDSVVTVTVVELPNATASLQLSACDGETVLFNGQNLAPGSSTQFMFTAANGCDSVLTVTVVELPIFSSNLTLAACAGSSVTYNGQSLS